VTARVLWLIRGLGPGGAERLLVAHAQTAGPDFAYEAAYQVVGKDHLVPELEAAGVVVQRLGSGPTWPLELRRLVRDHRIDLVHAHSPAMAAAARVALRLLPGGRRPALVYTEHNRWDAYRLPTRWANAATLAVEDHVLAVSEEARGSMAGPFRRRTEVLHHGVDAVALRAAAGDRAATRAALGLAPDEPVAVQVANFRREKAHEVLVAAAKALRDRGTPVRFLLVGQGQRQQEITDLVAAEGVGDVVTILGFRDDVAAIVAASDLLVLSSDHEGLPVAVMEALTLGVPIVSTRVGGMPEAVTDGVEGLLVPPRDPEALADAVARVAFDADLRSRLGAAARERAAAFDASVATRRIEDVYRAALAARHR
jgi:glycosyltransferase involved in cell wall biosynthesis